LVVTRELHFTVSTFLLLGKLANGIEMFFFLIIIIFSMHICSYRNYKWFPLGNRWWVSVSDLIKKKIL